MLRNELERMSSMFQKVEMQSWFQLKNVNSNNSFVNKKPPPPPPQQPKGEEDRRLTEPGERGETGQSRGTLGSMGRTKRCVLLALFLQRKEAILNTSLLIKLGK